MSAEEVNGLLTISFARNTRRQTGVRVLLVAKKAFSRGLKACRLDSVQVWAAWLHGMQPGMVCSAWYVLAAGKVTLKSSLHDPALGRLR